eukprot:TRINITY_DN834_c0_g1_i1.p1 TRINITY_DN834_c0_g1~~TRINITY_DN834_c0_g1_i1.p1  ORF type:complete len:1098 (+),score=289.20 TRINITY_DN834_c0_g1_i1:93-3296(+)
MADPGGAAQGEGPLSLCGNCGHRQRGGLSCGHCGSCKPWTWHTLPPDAPLVTLPPWRPAHTAKECRCCGYVFWAQETALQKVRSAVTPTLKHHCRCCGDVFCSTCCQPDRLVARGFGPALQRGCQRCYDEYLAAAVRVEVHTCGDETGDALVELSRTVLRQAFGDGVVVAARHDSGFGVTVRAASIRADKGTRTWRPQSAAEWNTADEQILNRVATRLQADPPLPREPSAAEPRVVVTHTGGSERAAMAALLRRAVLGHTDGAVRVAERTAGGCTLLRCGQCGRVRSEATGEGCNRCGHCGAKQWAPAEVGLWHCEVLLCGRGLPVLLGSAGDAAVAPLACCLNTESKLNGALATVTELAVSPARQHKQPKQQVSFAEQLRRLGCPQPEAEEEDGGGDGQQQRKQLECSNCGHRRRQGEVPRDADTTVLGSLWFSLSSAVPFSYQTCAVCQTKCTWVEVADYGVRPPELQPADRVGHCSSQQCLVRFGGEGPQHAKLHCRQCGNIFCDQCCQQNRILVRGYGLQLQAGCDGCYDNYLRAAVRVELRHGTAPEHRALATVWRGLLERLFPTGTVTVAARSDAAVGNGLGFEVALLPSDILGEPRVWAVATDALRALPAVREVLAAVAARAGEMATWAVAADVGQSVQLPVSPDRFTLLLPTPSAAADFRGFGDMAGELGISEQAFLSQRNEDLHLFKDRAEFLPRARDPERAAQEAWRQFEKDVPRQELAYHRLTGHEVGRVVSRDPVEAALGLAELVGMAVTRRRTRVVIQCWVPPRAKAAAPAAGTDGGAVGAADQCGGAQAALARALRCIIENECGGQVGVTVDSTPPLRCPKCLTAQLRAAAAQSDGSLRCCACGFEGEESPGWHAGGGQQHFAVTLVAPDGSRLLPLARPGPPETTEQLAALLCAVSSAQAAAAAQAPPPRPIRRDPCIALGGPQWPPPQVDRLPGDVRAALDTLIEVCHQGVSAPAFMSACSQYQNPEFGAFVVCGTDPLRVEVRLVDDATDIAVYVTKSWHRKHQSGEEQGLGEVQAHIKLRLLSPLPVEILLQCEPQAEAEGCEGGKGGG